MFSELEQRAVSEINHGYAFDLPLFHVIHEKIDTDSAKKGKHIYFLEELNDALWKRRSARISATNNQLQIDIYSQGLIKEIVSQPFFHNDSQQKTTIESGWADNRNSVKFCVPP